MLLLDTTSSGSVWPFVCPLGLRFFLRHLPGVCKVGGGGGSEESVNNRMRSWMASSQKCTTWG